MGRVVLVVEVLLFGALILATRCWNHQQVFVGNQVYFTDADCYSRMTRVRLCHDHPGTILRHHAFENYPDGTTPHTTAPFDYLILTISAVIALFYANSLDLAGAWVSPMLALAGGIFLWFWTRRCGFRHRWPALLLYGVSPILVHGTQLGRPDHQSFLIVLVIVALCGEWMLSTKASRKWGIITGVAWGTALWVSLYEPLVLFLFAQALIFLEGRNQEVVGKRSFQKEKWLAVLGLAVVSAIVERRLPSLSLFENHFVRNWSSTIGELQHVPLFSTTWFQWGGGLLLFAPILFLTLSRRREENKASLFPVELLLCLLGLLVLLTIWQARWAYFLLAVFVVALPGLLEPIKSRVVVWAIYLLSLWPVASAWDAQLWPNEAMIAQREEAKGEGIELREFAEAMKSDEVRPFLAPWWVSPELAYWSGQPGVAGSSHESFPGILVSARFFVATDSAEALSILRESGAVFVVAYDGGRVAETSEKILGKAVSPSAICYRMERSPSQVESFLQLVGRNATGKLYQAVNNR